MSSQQTQGVNDAVLAPRKRAVRILLVSAFIVIGSFVLSLTANMALFMMGPWADVWVSETWFVLAVLGGFLAWFTRRSWLPLASPRVVHSPTT